MITFLEKLKVGRHSRVAVDQAAKIIVKQFQHDLVEMNIVDDIKKFKDPASDGCVFDTATGNDYATKVFIPDHLPSEMSTKAFLRVWGLGGVIE